MAGSSTFRKHDAVEESKMVGDTLEQSALLIVDMINDFSFPDGDRLVREAEKVAGRIAVAKALYRARSLPVIYVNDNFDLWTMGFSELVDWASRGGSRGRPIVDQLLPTPEDYFILKPKHSAFYETALPSLLEKLEVAQLTIAGIAGDSCVLSSAMDAHIRGFKVRIPSDTVASLTQIRNRRALQFMDESLGCDISPIGTAAKESDMGLDTV
jgi:nicotinamidase-related amidase